MQIDGSGERKLFENPRSVAVTPAGRVYWVSEDSPSELRVLGRGGEAVRLWQHNVQIRRIVCPEEFPYVLDRDGCLSYIKGKKRLSVLKHVLSIEKLGARVLVTRTPSQRGPERIPGSVLVYGAERLRLEFWHPRHLPQHYLSDGHSESILTVDGGLTLRRFDSNRGRWSVLSRMGAGDL